MDTTAADPAAAPPDDGSDRRRAHLAADRLGETGASLIEYALMIALVAFVCIGALTFFGGSSKNSTDRSATCIVTAGTPTYNCP